MIDTVYPTMASNMSGYYRDGEARRHGNGHGGGAIFPYDVYPTVDGHVAILVVTTQQWPNLCNAIGTGIADDKSVYPYVPEMIEFYLGEKSILANVPTYQCRKKQDLEYVLSRLRELVERPPAVTRDGLFRQIDRRARLVGASEPGLPSSSLAGWGCACAPTPLCSRSR